MVDAGHITLSGRVETIEPTAYVGRVYTFKIVEFQSGGRKFVVSRRALLEEEQKAHAAEVRQTITPGAVRPTSTRCVRSSG